MIGIEQLGPVLVVMVLLIATLWFLKSRGLARFGGFRLPSAKSPRQMETVERMPLTAQHSLHMVRVGDRVLVIGVSPSGCQLLTECPPGQGKIA